MHLQRRRVETDRCKRDGPLKVTASAESRSPVRHSGYGVQERIEYADEMGDVRMGVKR